jgi:outer membrane receptor protein involved in Fe transport
VRAGARRRLPAGRLGCRCLRLCLAPKNLGRAVTQGIELEAKFRLDQLVDGAPPVELRSNLSLFRSRVAEVPGPDNRLDEQPKGTLNLGADYRFRGTPLTLGGSLNLTPGYRTQVSELQSREAGASASSTPMRCGSSTRRAVAAAGVQPERQPTTSRRRGRHRLGCARRRCRR